VTPEGRVKAKVKAVLTKFKAYYHMPVMNGMGAPTLDFVGCHRGRFFAIETKAANKQPTERQWQTIETMRKSRAVVFVVNEVSGLDLLEDWLKEIADA
jgi:hypothetical protein